MRDGQKFLFGDLRNESRDQAVLLETSAWVGLAYNEPVCGQASRSGGHLLAQYTSSDLAMTMYSLKVVSDHDPSGIIALTTLTFRRPRRLDPPGWSLRSRG